MPKRVKRNQIDEIIVVDGSSSDGTAEIAKKYADKVIITQNSCLTKDRQVGINNAKNRYIAMIDADHRLKKGDIESLLKDLKRYNFSVCQSQLKSYRNRNWMNKGEEEMWELNHNHPGKKKMIGVAPAIYKKEIFEQIQFDSNITKTIDDTDFVYRLSLVPKISFGIGNTIIAQEHTPDMEEYKRKFKWYGIGDGEFCIKHQNRIPSMLFHLIIRYPFVYPFKALLKRKKYAARYCSLQGIVRAKWCIYTLVKNIIKK